MQTRLGLGLPVHLRPQVDKPLYSIVSSPATLVEQENHANGGLRKLNFVGRPLYQIAVCGYKVCACLTFLRLLERTNGDKYSRRMRNFIRCFIWVIILAHFATTMVIMFQCNPVEKSWKPWTEGRCLADYPTWNVREASSDFSVPLLTPFRPLQRLLSHAILSPFSYRYRYSSDCKWVSAPRWASSFCSLPVT